MTINYEQVDNVIRNIIFTINALKTANNQLESEISRLSNCNGTVENPHNHSSEIASIRKTIDNNEEKIKKLDSIWKGLTSFKDNVILKDSELAESINSPEKIAAYIAGVFNNGQIAINSKSDYDMFMNAKEFVDGMEMKIDNEIVIDEKNVDDHNGIELMLTKNELALKNTTLEPINSLTAYTQGYIQENRKDILYVDSNGYQRVNGTGLKSDPYMVAMSKYYFDSATKNGIGDSQGYGSVFKITYEDGNEIYVTLGDLKAPRDTKESMEKEGENYYAGEGNSANVLEFICNFNNCDKNFYTENMSYVKGSDRYNGNANKVTNGEMITKIELITDFEINWRTDDYE